MRNYLILLIILCCAAGCGVIVEPPAAPTVTPSAAPIVGDAERGAQIFTAGVNDSPPCSTCHQVVSGGMGFSLGPNLHDIAERAATRIEGTDAETYLEHSILEPHSFVVSGYRDIMYPDYNTHFNEQNLADVIAYLLTL
jgi:hypothetical protein